MCVPSGGDSRGGRENYIMCARRMSHQVTWLLELHRKRAAAIERTPVEERVRRPPGAPAVNSARLWRSPRRLHTAATLRD